MVEGKTVQRSLRSEIQKNIKENGFTLSKLSELSGISTGHFSEMLNSNPPRAITVGQLDALAKADNLIPLPEDFHRQEVTPWWASYGKYIPDGDDY